MMILIFLIFCAASAYAGFLYGQKVSNKSASQKEIDALAWSYAMDVSLDQKDPYESLNKMYAQMPFDCPARQALVKAMSLIPAAKEEISLQKSMK